MVKQIFLNLPVQDLEQSKSFFTALGFSINEQFSDSTAACIVVSDTIYVMLLTHEKFKQFTPKDISDATRTTELLASLSVETRDEVNTIADAAIAAGGTEVRLPQDHGFMYGRAFNDLDGHIWEVFWMNMDALPSS
ncbi:VOC family protein [Pontibacter chitinilyticus]|uniref:VOC family protein n=1 Tax=Pontibacter chitinilyticus TaxID=2674989 RepID=UPI00321B1B79